MTSSTGVSREGGGGMRGEATSAPVMETSQNGTRSARGRGRAYASGDGASARAQRAGAPARSETCGQTRRAERPNE